MKDDGLSTSFSNLLRKVREDLKIYFYHFKFLFFYFYISKLLFKFFKLITQNKNIAAEKKVKKITNQIINLFMIYKSNILLILNFLFSPSNYCIICCLKKL